MPTLLQQILNKPSRQYASPSSASRRAEMRHYHSVKDEMVKVARSAIKANDHFQLQFQQSGARAEPYDTSAKSTVLGNREDAGEEKDCSDDDNGDDSTGSEVFYTPNTSPRQSSYGEGEAQTLTLGGNIHAIDDKLSSSSRTRKDVTGSAKNPVTPPSRSSHNLSASTSTTPSRTPSFSSASSHYAPSASTNVASSSAHTEFSWPRSVSPSSTRATTPIQSEDSHISNSRGEEVSPSRSPSRRKRQSKRANKHSADDWAKDVRWLVSTDDTESDKTLSSRSSGNRRSRNFTDPAMLQTLNPAPFPNHASAGVRRANTVGSRSSTKRRTVGRRRMSAVWEEDESGGSADSADDTPHRRAQTDSAVHQSPTRTRTTSARHSASPRARPPSQHSGGSRLSASTGYSNFTTSSQTVDIPIPLPVSDGGSPSGFTSLVLPRAAYTPSNKRYSLLFGSQSHIDITRSGLSQTTMSTISITKGAAAASLGARPRFLSFSSLSISTSESDIKVSTSTPDHLFTSLPSPLCLTSHTAPPSKVNSHQILVQVYAVGVDGLDDLIVSEKVSRTDCYGFVPGRSFVGRAVECGYEVSSISKSDWVMGLLDVRKCGGLSEFIVVDKRRLTRCPRPSASLTLEQLALLPLCGIPAHRAVRTSENVQRGARALVLRGHDGAGALAVQELAGYGVHVTVQFPPESSLDKEKAAERLRLTEQRVKLWGAGEIKVDTPVAAVNALSENEFDLVIDTVGGRGIWDACRRVLHTTGQFTTLVGESQQAIPSVNAHFKSNLRSLKRAFVKKDNKSIGYAWVSPVADVDNDGEDIRDSLIAIGKLAVDGMIKPWVDVTRCVAFERAPTLFTGNGKSVLKDGQTGVVRIIG